MRGAWWATVTVAVVCVAGSTSSVLGQTGEGGDQATAPTLTPGTLAYDRSMWLGLLREHGKIRRTVRHTEVGVDAVTESEDPMVAAAITDHAFAMQRRMQSGSMVRRWDPVFAGLFREHESMHIEVTRTTKGVRISERGEDATSRALLRAHAIGLSAFVRGGFDVSPDETELFAADAPLPPDELTIGGIDHRFLLESITAEEVAALAAAGTDVVIDSPGSAIVRDATVKAGLRYVAVPSGDAAGAARLVRSTLESAEAEGLVISFICAEGNVLGGAWARYRVSEEGAAPDVALAEALAMQSLDPIEEARLELSLVELSVTSAPE